MTGDAKDHRGELVTTTFLNKFLTIFSMLILIITDKRSSQPCSRKPSFAVERDPDRKMQLVKIHKTTDQKVPNPN